MRFINKQFLADDFSESGSIVLKCQSPQEGEKKDSLMHNEDIWVDAWVEMRACSGEPAEFSFSFSDEKGFIKRTKKVDNLIKMLEEFKRKLAECWEDANKEVDNGSISQEDQL